MKYNLNDYNKYEEIDILKSKNEDLYLNISNKTKKLIKQYELLISKDAFFDNMEFNKKYYGCYYNCYNSFNLNNFNIIKKSELSKCIKKCDDRVIQLNKLYNDIEFLCNNKINKYISNCIMDFKITNKNKNNYDECLWEGYNKINKRLNKYWNASKNKIIQDFN